MCEMLVNSMREDIPVVIIRPSIIESESKESFPGSSDQVNGTEFKISLPPTW
jgi:hypothetical protein